MPIALLILAHAQPRYLGRMVRALRHPGFTFHIHVDRRAGLGDFLAACPESPAVRYLRTRLRVERFDVSQVLAALRLLESAFSASPPAGRFVLLSGADFPLRPAREIARALEGPVEHIRLDALRGPLRRTPGRRGPVPGLRRVLRPFAGLLPARTYAGFPLFSGSQWWALTRPCAAFILDSVASRPGYLRFFRRAPVPDESFFHSLVKASPFAAAISQDLTARPASPADEHLHGVHYIDWDEAEGPGPRVLTEADLPALLASPALFARKLLEPESDGLVAALESRLDL